MWSMGTTAVVLLIRSDRGSRTGRSLRVICGYTACKARERERERGGEGGGKDFREPGTG